MQKVCKAVLFIGFAVQIVLGICWMVMNFPNLPRFGESALYVEISKTLICDEYEGILYPVLILMARGIEELFRIPYYCILYLFQMGLAYLAGYQFLKAVGVKEKMPLIGGSMALLTFPMAMQCHLAVLPDSLAASFLLLELSFGLQILLKGQSLRAGEFVKVLAFWLLTGLTQPEYLYLGGIPVAVLFVYGFIKGWKNQKKKILYNGILILAFAGMITGVESLTQIEGYYGRTHQSMGLAMAGRCGWPYVYQDYENWPAEVKEYLTWEEALHIDYYADNMERILGRTLEKAVGVERAGELLWEIGEIGWQHHKNAIVHDAAWDVAGYMFSPMVVLRQFTGKVYDSYSGRNYDIMRMNTPQLTEYYFDYGCRWFTVGLAVAALLWLVTVFREKRSFWNAGKIVALLGWMFTVAGVALYYCLRGAGMMDYKKSVAVTLLWIVWMLAAGDRSVNSNRREG